MVVDAQALGQFGLRQAEVRRRRLAGSAFGALDAHAWRTAITLKDEGGETRLIIVSEGYGVVPEAVQMLAGMDIGWNQSIAKLAEHIARALAPVDAAAFLSKTPS